MILLLKDQTLFRGKTLCRVIKTLCRYKKPLQVIKDLFHVIKRPLCRVIKTLFQVLKPSFCLRCLETFSVSMCKVSQKFVIVKLNWRKRV